MKRELEVAQYVFQKAPILCITLNHEGDVLELNDFADQVLGSGVRGRQFSEILANRSGGFNLDSDHSCKEQVLTLETRKGTYQSYSFTLVEIEMGWLALGHMDVTKMEALSDSLIEVNQELNLVARELRVKNRELKSANTQILELTRTDPLTHLHNRRYFKERFEETFGLAMRKSQPLSLIMTDLDHFKKVNDLFGHDAGDRFLCAFASLMKSLTRAEDVVARFGGEEFVVLLPISSLSDAYSLAERIRRTLSREDLLGNGHRLTASFGISQLNEDDSKETLLKRADQALYQAKESGRNQTVALEVENQTLISRKSLPVAKKLFIQ